MTAALPHQLSSATIAEEDNLSARPAKGSSRPQALTMATEEPGLNRTPQPAAKYTDHASPDTVNKTAAISTQEQGTVQLPHVSRDALHEELGHAAQAADEVRQPWTATSLAGDLMHNMKHLEAVSDNCC